MRTKILTVCLSLCLLLPLSTPVLAAGTEDSALQTVQALGIITGDASGNVQMSKTVSRAEFAVMLTQASVYKDTISAEGSGYSLFTDVKSNYWASEYIRLAIQEGWMTGYTDRNFRPEQAVTLEEACTALLKLMGYDPSTMAGSFPQAQLNKASALGLRDQVSASRGAALTQRDCVYLFYNLLSAQDSSGQVYASTLGYTVNNGEVDITSVSLSNLSGPYIAQDGSVSLPFVPAAVYRDGELTEDDGIHQYDVYYYNAGTRTLWIYTDRVAGKITELAPSATEPTSVTVGGIVYSIGSSSATYQLSALGGGSVGEIVTLLLGMDGTVVGVLSGSEVEMLYYGIVQSSTRTVNSEDDAVVQTSVTLICTDGVTRTFTVDKDTTYSTGRLLSVDISGGEITVKSVSERTTSGKVNRDGTKLGDLTFADDIEILDCSKEGDAAAIDPERLANQSLNSSHVRHYVLDEDGEISHLILNDATGDIWSYGYLIGATDLSPEDSMSINMQYTYMLDGTTTTITSSTKYPITSGGLAIRYDSDGSIKSMKNTKSVRLTSFGLLTARAENQTYEIWEDAQVYLRQNGNYYLTDLSSVNVEDYTLTGYYDDFGCPAGGLIRIIIAVPK